MANAKGQDNNKGSIALYRAAASHLVQRQEFAHRVGMSFPDPVTGIFRRDVYGALGYERAIETEKYAQRFRRGGIAKRIITAYPDATWSEGVQVVEDMDPNNETRFEREISDVFTRLNLWHSLKKADRLAGIGRYAVILIGAAGDLSEPLPDTLPSDQILYLTVLSELRAKIEKRVEDTEDERFGLPETYQLVLSDSGRSADNRTAHWSRIIHVAEDCLEDRALGTPRLEAIWNYLDDLTKVVGGGAEASWRRGDPGMNIDIDPKIQLGDEEVENLAEQVDEYMHNLRRVLRTRGAKIDLLSSSVPSFGPNAHALLDLISGTTGIPKRILLGSERGELASTQDRSNWADRIKERRDTFATPLVREAVDRLIAHRSVGDVDYEVIWPEIDALDEAEKATVVSTIAAANKAQKEAQGTVIMTANEIREDVLGKDPIEEVEEIGVDSDEGNEDVSGESDESEDENVTELRGAQENDPDLTSSLDEEEWEVVHRVADSHAPRLEKAFKQAFNEVRNRVDMEALEAALEVGDRAKADKIMGDAMIEFGDLLDEQLPQSIVEEFSE